MQQPLLHTHAPLFIARLAHRATRFTSAPHTLASPHLLIIIIMGAARNTPSTTTANTAAPSDNEVVQLTTQVRESLTPFLPALTASTNLSSTHVRIPRELRSIDAALSRLRAALRIADRSAARLFDHGAKTDVLHALREVREIAARANQGIAQRPRIYAVDRPKGFAAWMVGSSKRSDPPAHHSSAADFAKINLVADERKRLEAAANKIDTNVQVALWKSRANLLPDAPDKDLAARDTHLARLPSHHYPVLRKARLTMPRPRMGRKGRVFSTGEMNTSSSSPASTSQPPSPHLRLKRADSTLRDTRSKLSVASSSDRAMPTERPWEFSLIEYPITPLRSRTLDAAENGNVIMAMWRGSRVSVKVIRRDRARFYQEGDYLYALGHSPNIPTLLGGHWENCTNRHSKNTKRATDDDGNVGYLVMEVANGISLDKLVRDGKLTDTVSQIRVLDRIVAALVFAQKVNPYMTHQDLHPGNVLLVPSCSTAEALHDVAAAAAAAAAATATADQAHLPNNRTTTSLTTTTTTSFVANVSQSTVGESIVGTDANKSSQDGDAENGDEGDTIPSTQVQEQLIADSLSSSTAVPTFPNRPLIPQIPKVEDGDEALTVLERVALHNKLDQVAEADFHHGRLSLSAKPVSAATAPLELSSSSPSKPQASQTNSASYQPSASPTNVVLPSVDSQRKGSTKYSSTALVSSFTVKVMDFAPADEANGSRTLLSWHSQDSIAGYCAPEKATSRMWRRMQNNKEKERERERELERERRLAATRPPSNGRHSPRPTTARTRSNNGAAGFATASARSSSDTHRRPFDSETYALFEDDHLGDLGEADDNSLGPDIVPHSPTDRSGRRVAARGPDAFNEDDLLGSPVDAAEIDASLCAPHNNRALPTRDYVPMEEAIAAKHSKSSVDTERTDADSAVQDNGMSKVDVWSIGWLLYYMATGKHPPSDCWARRIAIDERELKLVGPEARQIIQMCVQRDVLQRACIRDVKRHIDSILQGLMFAKGLALIDVERAAAFVLLDKAVGIKSSPGATAGTSSRSASASADGDPGTTISSAEAPSLEDTSSVLQGVDGRVLGLNQKTRMALAALPLVVVRRVEWEAAARYLGRSNSEVQKLRRALVNERWNKTEVIDGPAAVEYLCRRSEEGVASAQSALGWVYRWGAGGVKKNVEEAMRLWEESVKAGDPEAANGLGLIYHHGREEIMVDGERARGYYELAVQQGYPAAAVNLGVMLHDGAAGLGVDGATARRLYEMACRHGDGIAANNLGLLLQHGAEGVECDAAAAVEAFELAIERNERHHACRNLGELLWEGAAGVARSRSQAVEYFALAIAQGDATSRSTACAKLRKLMRCAAEAEEGMAEGLAERCQRLLEG